MSSSLLSARVAASPEVPVRTGSSFELAADAELRELRRLADRAELWASIAPGLGHHLANALMSLSAPTQSPLMRESAHNRVERAHRVLAGLCDRTTRSHPVALAAALDEVDAWQRLQLAFPPCAMVRDLDPGVTVPDDARLLHALIAIVTLAKSAGAVRLDVRGLVAGGVTRIRIAARLAGSSDETALLSTNGGGATAAVSDRDRRRCAVVEDLIGALGGSVRVEPDGGRHWHLELPSGRS